MYNERLLSDNFEQSQLVRDAAPLIRTEIAPLGESGGSVLLESIRQLFNIYTPAPELT